jgi:hypothetical protein
VPVNLLSIPAPLPLWPHISSWLAGVHSRTSGSLRVPQPNNAVTIYAPVGTGRVLSQALGSWVSHTRPTSAHGS